MTEVPQICRDTERWIDYANLKRRDEEREEGRLWLYCDATPSRREILGTTEAGLFDGHLARLCVVIPARDVVIIKKFPHQCLTKDGAPNVNQLELFAVELGLEYCRAEGVENFSIYTDSTFARDKARQTCDLGPSGRVWWVKRDFNPAGVILDRITKRAVYLMETEGKVGFRVPNAEHDEILRLMQAEDIQCTLSELRFWYTSLKRKVNEILKSEQEAS